MRFLEDGREWRLPVLLFADDLVFCRGLNLKVMVGNFVESCKRRGLAFNANKGKVMVLDREEKSIS